MSTTTTQQQEDVDLTLIRATSSTFNTELMSHVSRTRSVTRNFSEVPENASQSTIALPDGGYGWTIVTAGFIIQFCHNGIINCWGVLQAALLASTLRHVSPATLTFVGSLALANSVFFGPAAVRLMRLIGCRYAEMSAVFLMGMGMIGASFSMANLAGLFGTFGVMCGLGMAINTAVANSLPVQYFSAHLGLANGIIKLGGGVGGCVMAIALQALFSRVGIEWTFRFQGLMTLAIGLPAAWKMTERVPLKNVPFVDLGMFRSSRFVATFLASAIGVFALYVPPYYLPLFATSIDLSPTTGAGLVAAFNACNALGRFAAGPLADKLGPLNMFALTMILNAVSMLAIWPVSSTLAPLAVFSILNGMANGSFFTIQPTVVAGIFGSNRAAIAMSMSVAGWTPGYIMGAPIAGWLLSAAHKSGIVEGVDLYRPAIFYAGGTATLSACIVLATRIRAGKNVVKWV